MNAMSGVALKDSARTLWDAIVEWKGEDREDTSKYFYGADDEETVFTLKILKSKFQGKGCKTVILQDVTAYDKLVKLDSKYQKLYVASVVHDIRTPLNGVMGMLEMLRTSPKSSEENEYLAVAMMTCKLLLFLTHDITDYSQLEANKFKACNSRINVGELLDETMQLLSFSFEKKKVRELSEISESVPKYVNIDKNRYMQILLNLLGNALKFTFQGEVKVTIDYDSHHDLLITAVRDTGIGIKEEEIPRLFKLFGKLESSEAQNPQGVGFGLAICKRLSESLGGYITVASKYGFGSTFTFGIKADAGNASRFQSKASSMISPGTSSLVIPGDINIRMQSYRGSTFRPLPTTSPVNKVRQGKVTFCKEEHEGDDKDEEQKLCMQHLQPHPGGKACRCSPVLIVDDSECNLFVLQSYLRGSNIIADEAQNGQEALNKIIERSMSDCCTAYKLVIMDINMPVLGGIEATKIVNSKIRTGELPATTIVALSAGQLRADEEELYFNVAGFASYIPKPTSREDFMQLLLKYKIIIAE